ncbi:thermonuclease family protein [Virgibacillus soli]|uniref:Thermonuclease family protein n=1 Tax=Paracerasibacillus soli TaxID=480284 RepID=A0ABU5CPU3_9BACI|nr:thermonuclease family protein [Virgibacillus soli]MDY0407485.1 thermonuclease family protein [Virgibacillus soli]
MEKQTVTKADIEKVESTRSPKAPVAKKIEKEKPKKKQVISNGKRVPVTLVRTVDGDTIKVRYKGKEENVRYLLIDTPESKKPGTCVQSFANEASERNKQLVNSGELTLEFEKSERDKYGRLLAYVFVDGKSVQEILLKEGYARVAYIYEPPYKYLSAYQKAENVAKDSKRKVWSQVGFATERGFNGCADRSSSAAKSNTSKSSSTTKPAKQSTQKSTTTSQSAKVEIFKNCTELRKKYPNGVPKGHPAYQPKMDRDKDNFACEA